VGHDQRPEIAPNVGPSVVSWQLSGRIRAELWACSSGTEVMSLTAPGRACPQARGFRATREALRTCLYDGATMTDAISCFCEHRLRRTRRRNAHSSNVTFVDQSGGEPQLLDRRHYTSTEVVHEDLFLCPVWSGV